MKRTKYNTGLMEKLGELRGSLKKTDWSWISGFLDGEGYIGIKKGYTENKKKYHSWSKEGWYWYTPRVNVCNTDKEALNFIDYAFNGSVNICERKMYEHNLRPLYSYEIGNRNDLRRILPELIPYLRVKKEQAKLVYRLVCLPRGSGPEKEAIWKEYDVLITKNGQKAVGNRLHGR